MIDQKQSDDEQAEVLSWLRDFNFAENEPFMTSLVEGAEEEFFIVSRGPEGKVQGGLRATFLHRWLKIDVMSVRPEKRGQGIGRELVLEAERRACDRGCFYSFVDTMSFQAPDFYSKLGYIETGRLKNWDSHGHDKVFFTKTLLEK